MPTKPDTNFIHLDPNHMGVGDLLTEVSRAYLYHGNPSAHIHRILEGVVKYRQSTDVQASREDRTVMSHLEHGLRTLWEGLRQLEDNVYTPEEAVYKMSDTPSVIPPPLPQE